LDKLYSTGADPVQIVEDLLDLTHFLTKCKVIPNHAENMALPEIERTQGGEMAAKLSMPVLTRVWQILNKGLSEVRFAPNAMHALEMVLVRLLYAADVPPPGDLVKKLENQPAGNMQAQGQNAQSAQQPNAPVATAHGQPPQMKVINGGPAQAPAAESTPEVLPVPKTLADVVALCHEKREPILGAQISNSVVPVKFTRGRIEIALTDSADRTLTGTLSRKLSDWTGERWVISVAQMPENVNTLAQDQKVREDALKAEILGDPNVSAIVTAYPGTEITDIQDIDQ
jgi:DNA polymerase-3 subunit gamma/tau